MKWEDNTPETDQFQVREIQILKPTVDRGTFHGQPLSQGRHPRSAFQNLTFSGFCIAVSPRLTVNPSTVNHEPTVKSLQKPNESYSYLSSTYPEPNIFHEFALWLIDG